MGMFDPVYVTEVMNDLLSRHGLHLVITPKENPSQKAEGEQRSELHKTEDGSKAVG